MICPHGYDLPIKALHCSIHALVAGVRAVRSKDLRQIGFHLLRTLFQSCFEAQDRADRMATPLPVSQAR
jgi:hypothetical protein